MSCSNMGTLSHVKVPPRHCKEHFFNEVSFVGGGGERERERERERETKTDKSIFGSADPKEN